MLTRESMAHLYQLFLALRFAQREYVAHATVEERCRFLLLFLHDVMELSVDQLKAMVNTNTTEMNGVLFHKEPAREVWSVLLHKATGVGKAYFEDGLIPTDNNKGSSGPSGL